MAKYVICADAELHSGVISVQCTARVSTSWNPFLSSTLIWNNEDKYTIRHFHICIAHAHTRARSRWRHRARADGRNEMSSSRNICVSWLISLLNGKRKRCHWNSMPITSEQIYQQITKRKQTEKKERKTANMYFQVVCGVTFVNWQQVC